MIISLCSHQCQIPHWFMSSPCVVHLWYINLFTKKQAALPTLAVLGQGQGPPW